MNDLYIPKKIKVGYQERSGTYANRLAYIIYYDDKGVLRKEKSWESWRDKKIDPEEFDNTPQDGFVFNKNVQRYNWSHFGSGRSLIRVYDPRGIEFEITTENLILVLMNTDCSKRGLIGKFVYAWRGPELVLLPTCCEEYEHASNYTNLQSCKITSQDIVPGCSYKTKKGEDLIYVGRYLWYHWSQWNYRGKNKERTGKKYHIFHVGDDKFVLKSDFGFLAQRNTKDIVGNFAEIIEAYKNKIQANKILSFAVKPTNVCFEIDDSVRYGYQKFLKRSSYFTINDPVLTQHTLSIEHEKLDKALGYKLSDHSKVDLRTQKLLEPGGGNPHYYYLRQPLLSKDQVQSLTLGDLFVTLENGKTIEVKTLNELMG